MPLRSLVLIRREFSSDGRLLVLVVSRKIHTFDVLTGQERHVLEQEGGHVVGLDISQDSRRLATCVWGRPVEQKLQDGRTIQTTEKRGLFLGV